MSLQSQVREKDRYMIVLKWLLGLWVEKLSISLIVCSNLWNVYNWKFYVFLESNKCVGILGGDYSVHVEIIALTVVIT